MLGWIVVLLLALAAFVLAAFVLKLPKEGWSLFGAALLFGLAGYAWQGAPEQPASPKNFTDAQAQSGEAMVEARKALFDSVAPKPRYLVLSDAYARQGRFDVAAQALRGALEDNPRHMEGWLALGMALVGHADGNVTPAAVYAYDRARELDPANPGPDYFLGISYLQVGEIRSARRVFGDLLERSPEDAPWRPELEARVESLDQMIANAPMLRQAQ